MRLEDFAARCGWPAKEAVVRSRLAVLGMLVTCRRCKGTGRYERNALDPTCYGCAGLKQKLPPLTARLACEVRRRQEAGELDAYYRAQLRERLSATRIQGQKTREDLLAEIQEFVGARKA